MQSSHPFVSSISANSWSVKQPSNSVFLIFELVVALTNTISGSTACGSMLVDDDDDDLSLEGFKSMTVDDLFSEDCVSKVVDVCRVKNANLHSLQIQVVLELLGNRL